MIIRTEGLQSGLRGRKRVLVARKFAYAEAKLADTIGVSRTDLRTFRNKSLKRGEDWRKQRKGSYGHWVLFSEEAVKAITEHFGIQGAKLDTARIEPPPSNGTAPQAEMPLVKVSAICLNVRRINAVDERGKVFEVLVGNNEVWAIGNPLRVKVSEVNKMFWECAHKPPRYRGDPIYKQANGLS